MTDSRTLEIRLDGENQTEELLADVQAMERGEDVPERHVLVLENEAELHRLISPANLELLRAIRQHDPESMRSAADLVDRDFKEVHRNLTELSILNVIEFIEDGKSKRPVVRFGEIDINLIPRFQRDRDGDSLIPSLSACKWGDHRSNRHIMWLWNRHAR